MKMLSILLFILVPTGLWQLYTEMPGKLKRDRGESNWGQKGLRDRNSPRCTLSQNGYGEKISALQCDRILKPGRWPNDPKTIAPTILPHEPRPMLPARPYIIDFCLWGGISHLSLRRKKLLAKARAKDAKEDCKVGRHKF